MSDWKEFSLGEIADPKDRYSFSGGPFGSNLKSEEYEESGVRIIQLQNIGDGHFKDDYKIYTSKEKADELFSCNIYPGEIILSKMGDPVARATLIPNSDERYLMASDGIRLKVDATRFDSIFVLNAINSPQFRGTAEAVSVGSTRKRIGLTTLKGLTIYAPPLPEQKKIAEILSGIDKAIAYLGEQKQKHILTCQDLLDDHFSRSLESSSIPLADTLSKSIEYGANASASALERNGLRFLRITDINEDGTLNDSGAVGVVLTLDEQQKYQVSKGDVLLARTGNTVGKSYLYRKSDGKLAFAGYLLRVTTDDNMCLPEYLFLYTQSSVYKKWISDTCRTGAQPNINAKEYGAMLIPRKPISDQQLFVKIAISIRDSVFTIERKIQKLSHLKQALTSDLLSGRKRVSV